MELPFEDASIVAALSGGADSLALMLALQELLARKKLRLRIVAAHFNHKLRGRESDADEEFVRHLAEERGFELAVGHGTLAKDDNLEQAARNARYAFLRTTAETLRSPWVLTAHTMSDQAETFLLNLIRGSGVDGLGGMRPLRPLNAETGSAPAGSGPSAPILRAITLVRPLLRWARREDTENFCREMGVQFRYDTMNEDMSFKRVRVRKMLIPMLREFNPKIIETLSRTAELMQHGSTMDRPTASEKGLEEASDVPEELSIQYLRSLGAEQLRETIRLWLGVVRGDLRSIGLKHIEAIERLALSRKSGRVAELPGFGRVTRHRGRLRFGNIKVD